MSVVMASQQEPPTPPVQDPYAPKQSNLRTHPGAAIQYQQDYFDNSSFMPPGSSSAYNSPRQGQTMVDNFGMNYHHNCGSAAMSPYQENPYQSPVQHHTYPNPDMYGRTSTPDHLDTLGRSLRQPRRLAPNSFSRTPSPPKRRKAAKKDSSKKSKLDKPLSELTAHLEHIPIKDTETWVNRSLEQRKKEVGNDGFIKRPSNSFILYRSAYADRCREYEKSNNHQDISSMAGASWAIEATAVRKQYEDWAKVERENHQAAFPDYKFQPQTQEAKARKRKEKFDDDSFEESDLDDPTYNGRGATPGSARTNRVKKMRRGLRESSYTPSVDSDENWGSPEPYPGALYNASYYHSANPGKPLPSALTRLGPNAGYYQATSHPNGNFSVIGHVEDVIYQPSDGPPRVYDSPVPAGLPGISHEDLVGDSSLDNGHLTFTTPTLDPELLGFTRSMPESFEDTGSFQAEEFLGSEHNDFGIGDGQLDGIAKWEHFDVAQ